MKKVVIMMSEPSPSKTAADVRSYFDERKTEADLADAYAISHNKFWWFEDDQYDYEKGTPEYKAVRATVDEWGELLDGYKEKIFAILRSEGVIIPETGHIAVLRPFMERNGYVDGSGWWIKDKKNEN